GSVLVLRHAVQPPDRRDAVDDPARLGVGADVALHEERALPGIETGRQEHRGQGARLLSQKRGILGDGERVQVHDAEVVLLLRLPGRPALNRPQVVPEMHVAGGLDAAEDAWAPRWSPAAGPTLGGHHRLSRAGCAAPTPSAPGAVAPSRPRKFPSSAFPDAVRIDSGWNCTPSTGSVWCRSPMISPSSLSAEISRHAGSLARRTTREW